MKTALDKVTEGRQYRSVAQMEPVQSDDGSEYIVEGYASTFGTPYTLYDDGETRIDEQVDARAFDETDMSDVIMQYDHTGRVFARESNGTLEITPDEHGLHVRADLGGTELGRQVWHEIRDGYTSKMSFGFTIADDRTDRSKTEDGKNLYTRTITRVGKLYDVSAVSLPANDATEISARGYVGGVIDAVRAERLEEERRAEQRARIAALLHEEEKNGNY